MKVCEFCEISPSQYTCPYCKADYCSYLCFQSKKLHGSCIENFARREVTEQMELRNETSSTKDRVKLLQKLRNFNDTSTWKYQPENLEKVERELEAQLNLPDATQEAEVEVKDLEEYVNECSVDELLGMLDDGQKARFEELVRTQYDVIDTKE